MSEIKRYESTRRMSRTVVHNGIVYLAGITSAVRSGDITTQTKDVLATVDARLASVGSSREKILSAQIRLRDIRADFVPMNDIWDRWVPISRSPALATCEAKLAAPELLIEVVVTAAV